MSSEPSIWNRHSYHLHNTFNTLTAKSTDPTKLWIEYLMNFGGFMTLLGIPALSLTFVFILRARWLKKNRQPHNYGRTDLIFWPSQIFMVSASLIQLSLAWKLFTIQDSDRNLLVASLLTSISWVS